MGWQRAAGQVKLEGDMSNDVELPQTVGPSEVARRLKLEYSRGVKDHTEKVLEEVIELSALAARPEVPLRTVLTHACELITKRLGIAITTIALRNHLDGIYRYEAFFGLPDNVVSEFLKLSYTREMVTSENTYKSHEISSRTRAYLGEDHPYAEGEEFSYRRPGLLDMKRRSVTDSLEADYIDTFFHDAAGEIAGWIEISGTRLNKIPEVTTIKWVEAISFIIGAAVRLRRQGPKDAP